MIQILMLIPMSKIDILIYVQGAEDSDARDAGR